MIETKARNELNTIEVEAKRKAADEWCLNASSPCGNVRRQAMALCVGAA